MTKEIVTRKWVSIPDTLRLMKVGDRIVLNAAETVSFNTAASAVCRANKKGDNGKFEIISLNNGCAFKITRLE